MKIYVRAAKRPDWMPKNMFTEAELQQNKLHRKMLHELDRIPDILVGVAETSEEWYDLIGDIDQETDYNKILAIAEDALDVDYEIWEADDLIRSYNTLKFIVSDVYDLLDEYKNMNDL
ncbi:MAG: hypothetical protein NC320_01770 [Clostridium sp.]|nr:hypothetical protein [Clostridium sp.]